MAKTELVTHWAREATRHPDKSTLILAYTNQDVFELNTKARDYMKATGRVSPTDYTIQTERGPRQFADGDRIIFLRNEKSMDVKNGSLGTVLAMDGQSMTVLLDTGSAVAFATKNYRDIDYGYAATIHKTQGTTVDRSFVLATRHFDKHTTYVSMSRHRDDVSLYYGRDQFNDFNELKDCCGRERPKHLVADFALSRGVAAGAEFYEARTIEGFYNRDVEIDGKKYAVLDDFMNNKRHLIPFREEYGAFRNHGLMQYDGVTLQYPPQKSPIEKTLGRELPGKER
jgi:hypothetical protein